MKKLILCACCLFLSGAAANALSFRNDSDQDAKVNVQLSVEEKIAQGSNVTRITPKVTAVSWSGNAVRSFKSCDLTGKDISMSSNTVFVYKKTGHAYSCAIE